MFMKCRYMDELTGGKGVVFTETPVSNSMTELYTMMSIFNIIHCKEMDWYILIAGQMPLEKQ